jgi:phosphatidylserine decarboxylase
MGPMKVFQVAMSTAKEMPWEAKHNFVVTFWLILVDRFYACILSVHLQTSWMVTTTVQSTIPTMCLWHHEADDTNNPSHLKLTPILNSLGSTHVNLFCT